MKQITNDEIKERLATLPALIARAAQEAEDARVVYEKQKLRLKNQERNLIMEEKRANPKIAITELKEVIPTKLQAEYEALLEIESVYEKKRIELTSFDNSFTGYKRIAQIRIIEIQSGIGYKEN
jgi:hypothetical protein